MERDWDPWPQTCLGRFGQKKMKTAKEAASRGQQACEKIWACLRAASESDMFSGTY